MRGKRQSIISIVFLALALLSYTLISGKDLKGRVVSIQDGDTVTLLQGNTTYKIRLNGIDCPEKKQAFGNVAKQFTANMVFGKQVKVQYTEKDRYGRYLGTVITADGKNLNKELLKAGLAWHYKQYSDSVVLAGLEDKARAAKIGLWSDPDSIPPWEFRQRKKEKS